MKPKAWDYKGLPVDGAVLQIYKVKKFAWLQAPRKGALGSVLALMRIAAIHDSCLVVSNRSMPLKWFPVQQCTDFHHRLPLTCVAFLIATEKHRCYASKVHWVDGFYPVRLHNAAHVFCAADIPPAPSMTHVRY